MGKTISEINDEFKSTKFEEWYIDNIAYEIDEESNDFITKIVCKYIHIDFKQCRITDEDAEFILKTKSKGDHIIISTYKDCLLSCNPNTYKNNSLLSNILEFISIYFSNAHHRSGLSSHTLTFFINWLLYKYPSNKSNISEILFNNIMAGEKGDVMLFSISTYFYTEIEVQIFDEFKMRQFFDKFMIGIYSDSKDFYFYADTYLEFINEIFKNKKNKNDAKQEYCNFALKHLKIPDFHWGATNLPLVRDFMDEFSYSRENYVAIDEKIESFAKEALSNMQLVKIDIPDEFVKQLDNQIKKNKDFFNALSNKDRIIQLLIQIPLISEDKVKDFLNDNKKKNIFDFDEKIMDIEGKIINYKRLNEEQIFSLKAKEFINLKVRLYFNLLISPFFEIYKNDDDTKNFINAILSNNRLVSKDYLDNTSELIALFFEKDFKSSVFDLVQNLEALLRYFFKNEGYNIKKRNSSGDYIGLSDIFSLKDKCDYRDKLLETITEDYYFTLRWLLVDEYGYQLRHKIAHRYAKKDEYNNIFAIYAVILIIKLIFGFSNE